MKCASCGMPDTAIGMDRCYCEPKPAFSEEPIKLKLKERFILRGKGAGAHLVRQVTKDIVVPANTQLVPPRCSVQFTGKLLNPGETIVTQVGKGFKDLGNTYETQVSPIWIDSVDTIDDLPKGMEDATTCIVRNHLGNLLCLIKTAAGWYPYSGGERPVQAGDGLTRGRSTDSIVLDEELIIDNPLEESAIDFTIVDTPLIELKVDRKRFPIGLPPTPIVPVASAQQKFQLLDELSKWKTDPAYSPSPRVMFKIRKDRPGEGMFEIVNQKVEPFKYSPDPISSKHEAIKANLLSSAEAETFVGKKVL